MKELGQFRRAAKCSWISSPNLERRYSLAHRSPWLPIRSIAALSPTPRWRMALSRPLANWTRASGERGPVTGGMDYYDRILMQIASDREEVSNVEEQDEARVLGSLEKPFFRWRTISDVSAELALDSHVVKEIMSRRRDQILRSASRSPDGERLFTTRRHYRAMTPVGKRFLNALAMRVR